MGVNEVHDEWCTRNGCRCGKCPCDELPDCAPMPKPKPPKITNLSFSSSQKWELTGLGFSFSSDLVSEVAYKQAMSGGFYVVITPNDATYVVKATPETIISALGTG